jgi:hypothetical protein
MLAPGTVGVVCAAAPRRVCIVSAPRLALRRARGTRPGGPPGVGRVPPPWQRHDALDVLRLRWLRTAQAEAEAAWAVDDEIAAAAWEELRKTLESLVAK